MLSKRIALHELDQSQNELSSSYGTRYMSAPIPRYELPEGEMPARIAYQIIHASCSWTAILLSTWRRSLPPGWSPRPTR
jgi:glutamate/tyrosine decarboxylase-like PLP-dependent enzyme